MKKSFWKELGEAVVALILALTMTSIPCAIFGVLGTLVFGWGLHLDTSGKLLSWGLCAGAMFIYALVDRVTLRIYSQLTTYTYRTGRLHLSLFGLVGIMFYGWGSTDMRPQRNPRPRAFYYNS